MTLRCRIEIVPGGDETRVRELARFDISREGRSGGGKEYYQVVELDQENRTGGMWQQSILHDRKLGAIQLVRHVLDRWATLDYNIKQKLARRHGRQVER